MINKKFVNKVVRKDDLTKIENYDKAVADKTQTWVCHHRLEITLEGEFAHSAEDLIRMKMYFNRPYFELIFLTKNEHRKLHNKGQSEETKKKLSEAHKGKPRSEEIKKRISETKKNKSQSEFGNKYLAHYGYLRKENPNQYEKERRLYHKQNHKCSWE